MSKNLFLLLSAAENETLFNPIFITIGCVIIAAGLISLFWWRRNQRIFHTRYENIIDQLKKEEKSNRYVSSQYENKVIESASGITPVTDKNINIHDSTINTILQKLEKFEKSERFLKKDKSLTSLANSLDTNPRYLSEIIKQYKGKNFNNYLNGLRIHYITQLLYKEPIYREYKISYLAEHCGFASREVFAIAFKKETGVTPSYFISQLRSE